MPYRLITLTFFWICSTFQVQAQTFTSPTYQTAMLELYTSQGCSSCPPAERWISTFTEAPELWRDIIPINFRVDYWDYLGWKDHYADPIFSNRQRLYQKLGHTRTVATPGFIVNGNGWNGWFYNKPIRAENLNNAGRLVVDIEDKDIDIHFSPPSLQIHSLRAHLVIMGFGLKDEISRGENRGKTFVQDFVVLAYDHGLLIEPSANLANDDTNVRLKIRMPDVSRFNSEKLAIAVWVSDPNDPTPIQAVGGWLE